LRLFNSLYLLLGLFCFYFRPYRWIKVLLVFMLIFLFICIVRAQTPQDTLNQYISELQNNPNNNALRERIIKLVQEMKPAPAIPEEARRHFVMAVALHKKASGDDGYKLAVEEYRQALLIAPWWPEACYNLGVVLESSKSYNAAIDALKLYLATKPKEADAREAQDKIYTIEAAAKLALAEARKRDEKAEQKKAGLSFEGKWLNDTPYKPGVFPENYYYFSIQKGSAGEYIVEPTPNELLPDPKVLWMPPCYYDNVRINGANISFHQVPTAGGPFLYCYYNLYLSADGHLVGSVCPVRHDGKAVPSAEVSYRRLK
jgi:tetratricopeptide (TPR) repeat protein